MDSNKKEQLAALLQVICQSPDDDVPRLHYAEFLEATGDEHDLPRAELIRIQIELARSDISNERWSEIYPRSQVLQAYYERWADELPKLEGVGWNPIEFPRGFIADIWCRDSRSFRLNAAAIFAAAPIQSLSFMRPAAIAIGDIADTQEASRLRRLILEERRLTAIDAKAIAFSSNLANLKALHVSGNQFGDAGAKAIADSTCLLRLDNLDLGHNRIGDSGVEALAASPVVASLSHLGLGGSLLTDKGAMALAASPHLSQLTGLTLWECPKIGIKAKQTLKARFNDIVSFED